MKQIFPFQGGMKFPFPFIHLFFYTSYTKVDNHLRKCD